MAMYTFWTLNWDELTVSAHLIAPCDRHIVIEARTVDGALVWRTPIDATRGDTDCLARCYVISPPTPKQADACLVIGADGEHIKGGSSNGERVFRLNKTGHLIV